MKFPWILRSTANAQAQARLAEAVDAVRRDYRQRLEAQQTFHDDEVRALGGQIVILRTQMQAQFRAAMEATQEALVDAYEDLAKYTEEVRPDGRPHCAGCAGAAHAHGARCIATKIIRYARSKADRLRAEPLPQPTEGLTGTGPVPDAEEATDSERAIIASALNQ